MDKELIQEEMVLYLVEENILPIIIDNKISFTDTIQNRKVLFNLLSKLHLKYDSRAISFSDRRISLNLLKIEYLKSTQSDKTILFVDIKKPDLKMESDNQNKDTTASFKTFFIMNKEGQVLSQEGIGTEPYFSNSVEKAIFLYERMVFKIIQRKEYSDCFVIEVESQTAENQQGKEVVEFFIKHSKKTVCR